MINTSIDTVGHSPTAQRVLHFLLPCAVPEASDRFSRAAQTPCPRN
jgi:hypothetical protein